jgi:hypothetical protein
MSNTLTGLIPTLFEAVDVVSRELVGFIPAVSIDPSAEQAALNQTITWPVAPAGNTVGNITPAATGPDPTAMTLGYGTMSISKSRSSTFFWEGEELKQGGSMYQRLMKDQFAQAMRLLVNEVEADLANLYSKASRAYGTVAVTPFASTLVDPANVRKILADNGAPLSDLQLVIDTTAGAALRTLAQLTKANEAGNDALLRRGILLDLHGFAIRESAAVKTHTAGAGTGYEVNGSHAIGVTSLVVKTGSGTILLGDVITLESDTANKYVVTTGVAAAGTAVLGAPGLRVASSDGKDVTILAAHVCNMAFARTAIWLATRAPAMPEGGDSADDVVIVTDPVSGIAFQIAMYRQYRRIAYEVGLAWGVKAVKPEHIAILLG